MAFQGVDVRQTTDRLMFRVLLLDSAGAVVTAGTTNLKLYELQSDGTLKSFDWSDNTFKSTALGTEDATMTHRKGNNNSTDTGLWTKSLTVLTGFTVGSIYFAHVSNTGASPPTQAREFQFGSAEGDMNVTAARIDANVPAGTSPNLRLVSTTMQASSTTTALIADAADLPTDTDDIYNGLLLVAFDVSAGNKPNVRQITGYTASTNTFTLSSALDFTPQTGVDTFEVWAAVAADSSVTTELLKLTTGFSAANPNNLNSYLKAMSRKDVTVPSGFGTYDPATDSLEADRELKDLMAGSGFSTSTDSLKAIRDAIDDLIAPVVAASGGSAGIGFLSECVSLIRKATDEPAIEPKYTDQDLHEYIHSAFDQVLSAINIDTDHPILCRFEVQCATGTQEYVLPCSVGEIWRISKNDVTTGLPIWELWPSNEYTFSGYGFTVEGNILRFGTPLVVTQKLVILYMPNSEVSIHTATTPGDNTDNTATTIQFAASPTEGVFDPREGAYLGYTVRLLAGTGVGQERIISAVTPAGMDPFTATVRPAWTTIPDDDTVYEVLPQYSRLIKHVVVDYATLDVLSNEAKTQRRAEIEKQLQRKMTALRATIGKKVNRFGTRGPGVDTIDNQDLWPIMP